jgi:hypothetical protein
VTVCHFPYAVLLDLRAFSLSSWLIRYALYRVTATVFSGAARSIRSTSEGLSSMSSAPRASSRRSRLRAPTRGTMFLTRRRRLHGFP